MDQRESYKHIEEMVEDRFYLSNYFIVLLIILVFTIPIAIGLLIYKQSIEKKIKSEVTELKNNKYFEYINTKKRIDNINELLENSEAILEKDRIYREKKLDEMLESKNKEIMDIELRIDELNSEYIELDDKILYQQHGVYFPEYMYDLSEEYQVKIQDIIEKEKQMIKSRESYIIIQPLLVDNSPSKGKKHQNDTGKLLTRTFNGECEESITKVTPINYPNKKKKIEKSFEQLNKSQEKVCLNLSNEYLKLKLERLELMLQYKLKLEEEKEKAKEERELLREEEKARKELQKQKEKLDLEINRFKTQLDIYLERLSKTDDEKLKIELQKEIDLINKQLLNLEDEEKAIDYRINNTRAGYVYVISNIGSFGEQVYKIGMTRRLEPEDRIKELSNASVPFNFDKHALIFSDDAYGLEKKLHELFNEKRVNKVNTRKEYFKVDLSEIKQAVQENFNGTVDFITDPAAIQYRETLLLLEQ